MTDTTRGDAIATPAVAAVQSGAPARARSREGYLFSPWFDFLCLGGGAVIICAIVTALLPQGLPKPALGTLILVLMTAINQPHFAHSYQIFYANFRQKAFGEQYSRDLRLRYIFSGLVVPVLLIGFFVVALATSDARLLSFGANIMFFLVGWHYVKQGYGILMVDAVQKKMFFTDQAKLLFRINGYACWLVAWVAINHAIAQAVPYLGLVYYTFDIPTLAYQIMCAVAAVTSLAVLWTLFTRWRELGHRLPWNGVVAYLTTLYLWVVFVRINPLVIAIVPTFHSLQYLAVVWRYEINATRVQEAAGKRSWLDRAARVIPSRTWRNVGAFVLFGVLLGYLGFNGLPNALDKWLPYDKAVFGPAMFLFMFYIFINVHHYFLDNVMWRRGNPDVRNYLFAKPK